MNTTLTPRIDAVQVRNWGAGGGAASIQGPKALFELMHHHPLRRELMR